MQAEALLGLALVGVAVASWSLAPSLASRVARRDPGLDPLAFNAWRMVFAAAALAVPAAATGFPYTIPWLDPVFQLGVVVGGVVATVAGDTAFIYAVARVGASVATPVAYMFVVWSALVDAVLGLAPPIVVAAALVSIAGVWMVAGANGRARTDGRGVAAALIASLVWTMGNYGYKAAAEVATASLDLVTASLHMGLLRALYASAVMAPALARWRPKGPALLETIGASLTGYVVGALAYIAALGVLPVSMVSVGLSANPVLVQLVAWLVAGEKPGARTVAGSLLVAAGIALAYA